MLAGFVHLTCSLKPSGGASITELRLVVGKELVGVP